MEKRAARQHSNIHAPPAKHLPPGGKQPWIVWKTTNRFRARVAKTKANMV